VGVSDYPVTVHEDGSRPRPGTEALPDGEVVVLDDGIADVAVADRGRHAVVRTLPEKLRGVDADDREPRLTVPLVPAPQLRDHVVAVDSAIRPELDEDDPPPESGDRERLAVDP